ncbi:hypothetical protein, partial [Microbacterium sp. KR10-403]|uniref:hypothetical protein n=1 Tax=Microbacterium sp. KR10-403 TaxID=3158581 RepID=UPI0032E4EF12
MRTVVFDTITGAPLLDVSSLVSAGSWSSKIDGSGQGSVTVRLREQPITRSTARDLFRANARMVAHVDDDDTVAAAGMFLTPDYDRDAGAVTCQWTDIRALFAQRMGFGVGSWGPSGTLTVTGRSRSGAVRAIVSRAMRDGEEPTWALPIDLPDDGTGAFTRTWPYYGFPTMEDCLAE